MFKTNLTRGFTLIELLVVIAIIGILAATVLASLGSARQSGNNASAQSSMASLRAQAELYYSIQPTPTYVGMCASSQVQALIAAARTNGQGGSGAATAPTASNNTVAAAWSATASGNQTVCHENATAWAAAVPLNGTAANFYCADSTGAGKVTTTPLPAVGTGSIGLACP